MTANTIQARRGATLDLGHCLIGQNLNLMVVRGYAPLDVLADISAPDVFDMHDNPEGTQRQLTAKHADESFEYAMAAVGYPGETDPRAFPEIILNARDMSVIEFYDIDDSSNQLELDSFTPPEELELGLVGVRIRISELEDPKPNKNPQISRVDGNHRLSRADEVITDPDYDVTDPDIKQDFPTVPFSLLVNLKHHQEARLFRDINHEHKGMETAHLDQLTIRINEEALSEDPKFRPLYIAHELTKSPRAFYGQVFMGGSTVGIKKAMGSIPPIKINALKSAVALQLRHMPITSVQLQDKHPIVLVEVIDRYWQAVREVFPDEWQNKRDFILLQSIGLNGFAKFGGITIDQHMSNGSVEKEDFVAVLTTVKSKVPLDRSKYVGIAGAGGANHIANLMLEAAKPSEVDLNKSLSSLEKSLPKSGVSLSES